MFFLRILRQRQRGTGPNILKFDQRYPAAIKNKLNLYRQTGLAIQRFILIAVRYLPFNKLLFHNNLLIQGVAHSINPPRADGRYAPGALDQQQVT
jgi:hypothetical protein